MQEGQSNGERYRSELKSSTDKQDCRQRGAHTAITIAWSVSRRTMPAKFLYVKPDFGLSRGELAATSFTGAHVEAAIDGGTIELVFHELPPLPPGYDYELWGVPTAEDGSREGEPVSLGLLELPGEELSVDGIEWPESYTLAVSIEAESGAAGRSALVAFVAEHDDDAETGEHPH